VLLLKKFKNGLSLAKIIAKQKLRILHNQPIIHIIGDSHALLFQHELFKIHYIGPATAYNLLSLKSSNQSKQKTIEVLDNLKKLRDPLVMFVLGEIDSRIHIYKTHKAKNIPLPQVIEQTAHRYITHLQELQKLYPHINFMLFNVLPPGEQGNFYNYEHYADRPTRLTITEQFNQKLQELTTQHQIPFIQTYHELINKNKDRLAELIFDDIHFNNKIIPFIIKDIQEKLGHEHK
jgi:lysophospholipase L1-like esterase